jgi:antitoxin FitA
MARSFGLREAGAQWGHPAHFEPVMPVNILVKNVPAALVARLRRRAERNHRSLQGELLALLEIAASEPAVTRSGARVSEDRGAPSAPQGDGLLERLLAIADGRSIDGSKRLSREQAHDRGRRSS